jgi:hypothetical protein
VVEGKGREREKEKEKILPLPSTKSHLLNFHHLPIAHEKMKTSRE